MTIGLILAGGKSSRFLHGDKALFFDDQLQMTWVEHAYFKLSKLCRRVVISANVNNEDAIRKLLPQAEVFVDQAPFIDQGPLSAFFAASDFGDDFLILAVDYPEISVNALKFLKKFTDHFVSEHFTLAHLHFTKKQVEDFLKTDQRRLRQFLKELGARPLVLPDQILENHNIS